LFQQVVKLIMNPVEYRFEWRRGRARQLPENETCPLHPYGFPAGFCHGEPKPIEQVIRHYFPGFWKFSRWIWRWSVARFRGLARPGIWSGYFIPGLEFVLL